VKFNQPKDMVLPGAIAACVFTAGIAFYSNSQKSAIVEVEQAKQIALDDASANQQSSYQKLLEVVAKEAIVNKITVVTFKNGTLTRIGLNEKSRPKTDQVFKPGLTLPDKFANNASTGLFDPYSSLYAAIGQTDGEWKIIHVYSTVEVQNKITQLQSTK
jgi:hypothetical protein